MKKLFNILSRSKVDLIIWLLVIAAFVQYLIIGKDLTGGYAILILYIFGVMYRLHAYNMAIRKQDQDILKLNQHIQDQADTIETLIKKYGLVDKTKETFRQRIENLQRKKNLEK